MNDRLKILFSELLEKCNNANYFEFEYYWEIWGVMWYPWTLEIKGKSESFSLYDISYKDLENLCNNGQIELIKEYSIEEMEDEFDRKRYRILNRKDGI
ncbi:hypothetical protein [uncultured Aquimarina sp.]|uniref:hypothetical protein n=1 Tax=uncultured Aquimarina sp. TaxID=575652 RepID=UPI00261BC4F7|nr:hypothetical protein [uncultured Aquimarina sp.]